MQLISLQSSVHSQQSVVTLVMDIYHINNKFSKYELYALTNHIRKSFSTICSNIGEVYRKRLDEANFVSKISDLDMKTTKPRFGLIKIARSSDCRLPTALPFRSSKRSGERRRVDCRLKNASNNENNHLHNSNLGN